MIRFDSLLKRLFAALALGLILSTSYSRAQETVTADDSKLPDIGEFIPVELNAEMIRSSQPKYPSQAKKAGITGLVWIKALVSRKGKVIDVVIYKSSGNASLDHAAFEVASDCKFKPAIQRGRPVAQWVAWKVDFVTGGSGGSKRTMPFSIFSHVDPELRLLNNAEALNLWPSQTANKALGNDAGGTTGQKEANPDMRDFPILLMQETDKSRRTKQRTLALVGGGCADGLKVGMEGYVWEQRGERLLKIATVEVQDVGPFESMCRVVGKRNRRITKKHQITLEAPRLDAAELLFRGEEYYIDGLYDQSLACFESLASLADSNAIVRARLTELGELCRIDTLKLSSDEKEALTGRLDVYCTIAESYLRLEQYANAVRYLDKISALDGTNEIASELREAIEIFESCKLDLANLESAEGAALTIDLPPVLLESKEPFVPFPPGWYYSTEHRSTPDTVLIRALISSKGRVLVAKVHQSSRSLTLNNAAVRAAYENVYEPAVFCGKPIATWAIYSVVFATKPL